MKIVSKIYQNFEIFIKSNQPSYYFSLHAAFLYENLFCLVFKHKGEDCGDAYSTEVSSN